MALPSQTPLNGALPDWSTLDVDLNCPRCGYNLRLLTVPRCPECGLTFDWRALAAAERLRRDNPLFEYQWRYRPVRSLLGTIVRTLYPPWLWRSVRLEVAPRIGPLLLLALIVGIGSTAVGWAVTYGELYYFNRFVPVPPLPGLVRDLALQAGLGVAIWLTLQVFWQTRARGHVRQSHLVRIVVLACVGLVTWKRLILTVNTGLAIGYLQLTGRGLYRDWSYFGWLWRLAEWIALGTLGWSLCLGLSRYLRVRGGVRLGLLTLAGVFTAVLISVVAIAVYAYDSFMNPWVGVVESAWPETATLIEGIALRILRG